MSGGGKKSGPPDIPAEATRLADPIVTYKNQTGRYPSNAQTWWAFKRPPEPGTVAPPKLYLEVFDPALRHQVSSGSTAVSRGHFIMPAFRMDRSAVSGVEGLPVVETGHRPSCVAFYAGRVFYGGVNTRGFNTRIYFSQIIERSSQVQNCHQAYDPTDEDIRDLLPTDGGEIRISEMAEAKKMLVQGQNLIVWATNGIWEITGSEGIGFRANDYSVNKVSSIGLPAPLSFVLVEGVPMWWSNTGIWMTQSSPVGSTTVQSMTDQTIKSHIDSIPAPNRMFVKGAYNPALKRVQWLYRQAEIEHEDQAYVYDTILNFDIQSGAWWVSRPYASDSVDLKGIFTVDGYTTQRTNEDVLVLDDDVYADTEQVYTTVDTRRLAESIFKYVIEVKDNEPEDFPPFSPPIVEDVFLSDDAVLVNLDAVQVTLYG